MDKKKEKPVKKPEGKPGKDMDRLIEKLKKEIRKL